MTDNERKFIKNVNIDKAKNKTIACIILTVISLLSYVIPLILGTFDFGMIFEIMTLFFILVARFYMSKYDIKRSKRYILLAIICICGLLIYDIVNILFYASNVLDFTILSFEFVFQECFTILDLFILFIVSKSLMKACNPEKYKESTDWFYERLEEEDKEKNIKL